MPQKLHNYLVAFDFDELFSAVDYVEIMIIVVIRNVSRVQPSVTIQRLRRCLIVVPISFHYLKYEQFILIVTYLVPFFS